MLYFLTWQRSSYGDFEWDDLKAARNLREHGVAFEEAAEALATDPNEFPVEDPTDAGRVVSLCMSPQARILFVVLIELSERTRLISARKAAPMSNASTRKSAPDMPEVDFTRAKRIVRRRKGHERLPLAAVRKAVGKTQVEVAEAADIPQAEVSRLEARVALGEGMRLSSLTRYARALGGEVEVAIVLGDRRYLIDCGK